MADSQITIQAVQFLDELVHISYAETRDQGTRVALGKSLYIQLDVVDEEVREVLDLLCEIIDKSLLDLRSPNDTVRGNTDGSTSDVEISRRME